MRNLIIIGFLLSVLSSLINLFFTRCMNMGDYKNNNSMSFCSFSCISEFLAKALIDMNPVFNHSTEEKYHNKFSSL